MREVSDAYLLAMAQISATLIGLFLVGVFFYADTGFARLGSARAAFEPYLRAGIRITLVVFAIPLILPLTLVVMEPVWTRVLLVLLSAALVVALVDTVGRVPAVWASTRSRWLVGMEVVMTALSVGLVVLPWALGGLEPTREDLNWAILLALGVGLLSVSTTVLSVFDLGRVRAFGVPQAEDERPVPAEPTDTASSRGRAAAPPTRRRRGNRSSSRGV